MKMKAIYMAVAALAIAAGCTKNYDDSAFLSRLDAVQQQIDKVRADLDTYNTEIDALQKLPAAYSAGSAVRTVEDLMEDGKQIGYKIVFDDGTSVDILHGKNGEDGRDGIDGTNGYIGIDSVDGHSPVVGVVLQNGRYYWTVDGKVLTDASGNPLPASADPNESEAENGVTPVVSMEDGKWYVTYDGVKHEVGNVADTEATVVVDGVFADENAVIKGEQDVTVTLADGTTMAFPLYQEYSITFSKQTEGDVLDYTVTGLFDNPTVSVMCSGGWNVTVDQNASTITIMPKDAENRVDANFNVLVSDGRHSVSGEFFIIEGALIYE